MKTIGFSVDVNRLMMHYCIHPEISAPFVRKTHIRLIRVRKKEKSSLGVRMRFYVDPGRERGSMKEGSESFDGIRTRERFPPSIGASIVDQSENVVECVLNVADLCGYWLLSFWCCLPLYYFTGGDKYDTL